MMDECWTFETVCSGTGGLHSIGHSRWSTREDTNLGEKDVLFLEVVKELVEVWTTKVGGTTETGEQTLAGELLKVALTDVLKREEINDRMHVIRIQKFFVAIYECWFIGVMCACMMCNLPA